MARLNVNPTRMELKKLRTRLATATRGHKLLKDKSDEMVRKFTILLRENKRLRDEVEEQLATTLKMFALARSVTSVEDVETAFALPSSEVVANCEIKTIMGVEVPKMTLEVVGENALPYGYGEMTSEADECVQKACDLLPKMLELAECEKAVRLLAVEIERNKRRVNALEYVMIPQLEETIKYIRSKLDENERAAIIRLMKVKSKNN